MTIPLSTSTIAQQAVRELEQGNFSSFADDSDLARDLASAYPTALDNCLSSEDWTFASRLADLPPAASASAVADPDLPYLYMLPADCVRLRDVFDDEISWRQDGDFLRATAETGLKIRYTIRTDNESKLPAPFRDWVSLRLAIMLAPIWLQSNTKRANLYALAKDALTDAKAHDRVASSGRRWDSDDGFSDWVSEALR